MKPHKNPWVGTNWDIGKPAPNPDYPGLEGLPIPMYTIATK